MQTADGAEVHFGVNHLGHFCLVDLLTPKLKASAPSRVVVVSSSLMNAGKLDLDNFDLASGRQLSPEEQQKRSFVPAGYADSKLMNALFAKELGRRLGPSNVHVSCICPGWCYTELPRHVDFPWHRKLLMLPVTALMLRSSERGSHNIVQAVVEDPEGLPPGGFYRECALADSENAKLDAMQVDRLRLWHFSEQLVWQIIGRKGAQV